MVPLRACDDRNSDGRLGDSTNKSHWAESPATSPATTSSIEVREEESLCLSAPTKYAKLCRHCTASTYPRSACSSPAIIALSACHSSCLGPSTHKRSTKGSKPSFECSPFMYCNLPAASYFECTFRGLCEFARASCISNQYLALAVPPILSRTCPAHIASST